MRHTGRGDRPWRAQQGERQTIVTATTQQPAAESGYTADDIVHLEGLDAVRKRPGMYVGGTDTQGRTHLVYEIVDNSVDEALAGHCTHIGVTLYPDGSVQVQDNGRGIPTGVNAKSGLTAVELVMTKLHAGGKFGSSGYKSAGGLHGVGASVVNALSARTDVTVHQKGKIHQISFKRGTAGIFAGDGPDAPFTAKAGLRVTGSYKGKDSGTSVRFWPDPAIFIPGSIIDAEQVVARARQTAFIVPGLTMTVTDQRGDGPVVQEFAFTGGLVDMVEHLTPTGTKIVTDPRLVTGTAQFTETVPTLDDKGNMVSADVTRDVEVAVAYAWNTGYDQVVESFVNVVRTPLGGTHRKGFERALLNAVRKSIDGTRGLLKSNEQPPILDDALEGLVAVVTVNVAEPQFVGQTKEQLGTPGVAKCVAEVMEPALIEWAKAPKTKQQARVVLEKIVNASRVRLTQKATKEAARRKTALESSSMPAKLADCISTGTDRSELIIVEGDSAAGSAKKGRNAQYQAILPIRGKILNVQKATLKQVLDNAECSAIIQCIGAGSGRTFDLSQMRYGRLIVLADADVDGKHIYSLLSTLAWKYMRPLVEAGRLYVAMPPLFGIKTKGRNPEQFQCYTQAQMEAKVRELEKAGKQIAGIQRFKGLGEMDAEELWSSTMNPATRSIKRVTVADVEAAEMMLDLAMGDEVAPRRKWIADNSDSVDPDAIDA